MPARTGKPFIEIGLESDSDRITVVWISGSLYRGVRLYPFGEVHTNERRKYDAEIPRTNLAMAGAKDARA